MKRLLSLLLVAILLAPMTCAYADEATSDMRLEATQGSVSVTDENGKAVTVRDGMKLFDAYRVSTDAGSYAWISLDQAKALKLDAESSVRINKSGDKLDIDLEKGALLVDVSTPLGSGEELNIRTSTTTTGVRGTVFFVRVLNDGSAQVGVLEGSVSMTYGPNTGNTQTVAIGTGQLGIAPPPAGAGAGKSEVGMQDLAVGEVGAFVMNEIYGNPTLANRLRQSTSAVVRSLVPVAVPADTGPVYVYIELTPDSFAEGDALQKALKEEPYLVLNLDGFGEVEYDTEVNLGANQTLNLTNSYLSLDNGLTNGGKLTVSDDSSLTAGDAENTGVIEIRGTINLASLTNTSGGVINVRGTMQINTYFNNDGGVINVLDGGELLIIFNDLAANNGDINVVNGKLTIQKETTDILRSGGNINMSADGELVVDEGVTIDNNGAIDNAGTITNNGCITSGGEDAMITNRGTIDNSGFGISFTVESTLVNNGIINNNPGLGAEGLSAVGGSTIENNATINNIGIIMVTTAINASDTPEGGILDNNGTINNSGRIYNIGGEINNNNGGTITSDLGAVLENGAAAPDGYLLSKGSLNNDGTITNNGTLLNSGSDITNDGIINNNSELFNSRQTVGGNATITNNSTISNSGTITNSENCTITNNGTINNSGAISGSGTISGNAVNEVDP